MTSDDEKCRKMQKNSMNFFVRKMKKHHVLMLATHHLSLGQNQNKTFFISPEI